MMKPFLSIAPKGEFETTAEFDARRAPAVATLPGELILLKQPEDREHLIYDADAQRLDIVTYAFHNIGLPDGALFGPGAPYEGAVEYGYASLAVVINYDSTSHGSYLASNAFGAPVRVARIYKRYRGVFERPASYSDGLFPSADEEPHIAGSVAMTPEFARKEMNLIKLAFIVRPKAPYFAIRPGKDDIPNTPSIDYPFEVTEEVSALIGDIQCGLVLDSTNQVLGSFETR